MYKDDYNVSHFLKLTVFVYCIRITLPERWSFLLSKFRADTSHKHSFCCLILNSSTYLDKAVESSSLEMAMEPQGAVVAAKRGVGPVARSRQRRVFGERLLTRLV